MDYWVQIMIYLNFITEEWVFWDHDSMQVAFGVILANWEISQVALEIMSSNVSGKYFPSYLK